MKYIKLFESEIKLVPGYMYRYYATDVCFIGHNDDKEGYNLTCFIIRKNTNCGFIEWASFIEDDRYFTPLNLTIEEYMIENNKVEKIIKEFKDPLGHVNESSNRMIKILLNRILNNEEIKTRLEANKYNL